MYLSNTSVDSVEEAINCRRLLHVYVYQIQTTFCIEYSMLILDYFIVIISVSRLYSTRRKPRSLVSSLQIFMYTEREWVKHVCNTQLYLTVRQLCKSTRYTNNVQNKIIYKLC